jgi:hypothetical protein
LPSRQGAKQLVNAKEGNLDEIEVPIDPKTVLFIILFIIIVIEL